MSKADALHNACCQALAIAGAVMLVLALFDWLLHPVTLWLSVQ